MMPGGFWAGWIGVATLTSLIGLAWLIYSIYFAADADDSDGDPVWDGNLREGRAPPPLWWFWLIFALLVFSVVYLLLYPGLGFYGGALHWSQGGRMAESEAAFEDAFGDTRRQIASAPLAALRLDADRMAAAEGIYRRHCAACHGPDATGLPGHFPDLTDGEWQWGGEVERIEQSIRRGRSAAMIGWQAVLGDDGVRQVAGYVQALAADSADAAHPGAARYAQYCIACHGVAGAGNPLLGAPSLIDDVSLYGSDLAALTESIAHGRQGRMPAFGERLDDAQIALLLAWLTRERPQGG